MVPYLLYWAQNLPKNDYIPYESGILVYLLVIFWSLANKNHIFWSCAMKWLMFKTINLQYYEPQWEKRWPLAILHIRFLIFGTNIIFTLKKPFLKFFYFAIPVLGYKQYIWRQKVRKVVYAHFENQWGSLWSII